MDISARTQVIQEFQLAFSEVYGDQIQQVILESRQEALAEAKIILRDRSLNSMLAAAVTNTLPSIIPAADQPTILQTERPRPKAGKKSRLEKKGAPSSALNDRILQEIEAIREQILRNEQLLSQIKPLMRSVNISKE